MSSVWIETHTCYCESFRCTMHLSRCSYKLLRFFPKGHGVFTAEWQMYSSVPA